MNICFLEKILVKVLLSQLVFVFLLLSPPKTVTEFEGDDTCVKDLFDDVVKALHELYNVYRLAHLNVQLPNICYREGAN